MADEVHPTMKILLDFQSAMQAGSGMTLTPDDPRLVLFDQRLKSGEFAQSGLADVAEALMENIRRLADHAHMPYSIFNYGRRHQEVYQRIYDKTASEPVPDDLKVPKEEYWHYKAMDGTWKWICGSEHHQTEIGWVTCGNDVAGFAVAPELADHVHERKRSQISAHASSLLIEAWTLFESLSEDLWVAALNSHPTILGELTGKPRSKFADKSLSADIQQRKESTVRMSFDDLQMNKFNVRSKLGTILKQRDDIGFRSIYDIRASYHRAFREQSKTLDEILDDPRLQYAAAVRNLLIHKRGIVDDEFRDQVAKVPDVPAFAEREPFPLTGKICSELADACRACATLLVNSVHTWIIGHREKNLHETCPHCGGTV